MSPRAVRRARLGTHCTAVAALVLGLLATGLARDLRADTIELVGGKVLEGTIISGDVAKDGSASGPLIIRIGKGSTVEIPRERVVRVVRGPSRVEQLAAREKALPAGDAAAVARLSQWCAKHRLRADARRLMWRVLEIDPDHAGAREALGFHKLGAVWLTEGDYQRALGKRFFDGRWLEPAAHERAVRKARSEALVSRARKLFRKAAGRGAESARRAALDEFHTLPEGLRAWTLLRASEGLQARDRQFAVRELGQLGDRRYGRRLAHLAVTDSKRSVRDEALRVLSSWQDPDTALTFLPYLSSESERLRTNAARALNVFPDRRAVGELIRTAHFVWSGFGRTHIAAITQRAFVADYELVSGGTGLVVQEVADPVVDTFQEGVVLDIDIRRAEAIARAATLQTATGRNFGADFGKWASWWREETGRAIAAGTGDAPSAAGTVPGAAATSAKGGTPAP